MTTPDQTPDELRIADRYLWVLDYLTSTAQAVRRGDWYEVADSAQDLARRAGQLAEAARELHDKAAEPRGHVVVGVVAEHTGWLLDLFHVPARTYGRPTLVGDTDSPDQRPLGDGRG